MEHIKLNLESNFKFDNIVVALGNFDGFHIGHQKLISELNNIKLKKGYKTSVFLFENHTRDLILSKNSERLMSFDDKLRKIEEFKIDYVFSIEFSEKIKNLSSKDFLDFLTSNLNIKHIVVGSDYKFANNREGNIDFIKLYMNEKGLSCTVVDKVTYGNIEVSSTKIIEYIKSGNIELANNLLGDYFSVKGNVIHGFHRGRNLGYPTANLDISFNYVMVKEGVYFTKTIIDGYEYFSFSNIGYNLTFDNKNFMIESHIFDFSADIYGKTVELCFFKRLRDNKKFNSVDELVTQLKKDEIICYKLISYMKKEKL